MCFWDGIYDFGSGIEKDRERSSRGLLRPCRFCLQRLVHVAFLACVSQSILQYHPTADTKTAMPECQMHKVRQERAGFLLSTINPCIIPALGQLGSLIGSEHNLRSPSPAKRNLFGKESQFPAKPTEPKCNPEAGNSPNLPSLKP